MKKVATKKSKKGFTLIELVVVIAILGILAAILVPVISGFINSANKRTDNANARLLYHAGAMYFSINEEGATITSGSDKLDDFIGETWPVSKVDKTEAFTVIVSGDGTIDVKLGVDKVYDTGTGKIHPDS